jgi:16S rRNA (guanine966-N2)-methyltransferase
MRCAISGDRLKRFLKLTGGSFMGRRLYVPSTGVRPATNLVREAVFSTLQSFFEDGVEGLRVVDLFAGSGSLGFEAISRGAASAVFVDRSTESVRSIRRNLEILNFRGQVYKSDVIQYLKRLRDLSADLVFMDPPYRYRRCAEVVSQLGRAIAPENRVLLVHERAYEEELPEWGREVEFLKRRRYGQTEILYVSVKG